MNAAELISHFKRVKRTGAGWMAQCPAHEDHNPSLSIREEHGKTLIFCHAGCSLESITEAAGLKIGDLFADARESVGRNGHGIPEAVYPYTDEEGAVLFEVMRFPGKQFRQRRPDGNDGWIWNLKGVRRVLYRLPKIIRSKHILACEGERDVETAERLGFTATCNPHGAGKWRPEYSESLREKRIAIIGDGDAPGLAHARDVARSLLGVAESVKLVEALPGAKDLTAWVERGGTQEALLVVIKSTPMLTVADAENWGPNPRRREKTVTAPELGNLVGSEVLDDVGAGPPWTGAITISADWPEPEQLGNDLLPVPAFEVAMLPEAFRNHVLDVSERMQVPIDMPAVCAVVCLAGTVNRRAVIQPKRDDTGWVVVPNLWGAPVARPARLKSPVMATFTEPLERIEGRWRKKHEIEMEGYRYWEEEKKLRDQAWSESYKTAVKNNKPLPTRPDETRERPVPRRLVTNDPTYEALQRILADNPTGVTLARDELTGWLATLDKHGREGERQFFLESWNGNRSFTADRITRGSVFAPKLCLSLLGGIQPSRLRQYLNDAIKAGPGDDGLFQRFQVIVWPDFPKTWTLVDHSPNKEAADRVARVYERLAELSPDEPMFFRFADDAQELFLTWFSELERKVRAGDLHPALEAHLGKYRSLMPSLALLFELADRTDLDGEKVVSLDHARQAAAWCTYLEAHARRIYGCLVSPELHAARELAGKISKGKLTGEFSTRDVYLKGWSGLSTPDEVRAALRVLEDAGWVRQASVEKPGGRPPERWMVNPQVKGERQ